MGKSSLTALEFKEALRTAAGRALRFRGRARRSEYWWVMLAVWVVSYLVLPLAALLALVSPVVGILMPFLGGAVGLLTVPLTFRRLHDTGRSGWWWGIGAAMAVVAAVTFAGDVLRQGMPAFWDMAREDGTMLAAKYALIGLSLTGYGVAMLVFLCQDSDPGTNRFGVSEKYGEDGYGYFRDGKADGEG